MGEGGRDERVTSYFFFTQDRRATFNLIDDGNLLLNLFKGVTAESCHGQPFRMGSSHGVISICPDVDSDYPWKRTCLLALDGPILVFNFNFGVVNHTFM
jgi:hypothetical protein